MRCAICVKNPCVCGCEKYDDEAAEVDYDDDGGEWTPAPVPGWVLFFMGVFVGFVLFALFGK